MNTPAPPARCLYRVHARHQPQRRHHQRPGFGRLQDAERRGAVAAGGGFERFALGFDRVETFQDRHYADLYVDRLQRILAAERAAPEARRGISSPFLLDLRSDQQEVDDPDDEDHLHHERAHHFSIRLASGGGATGSGGWVGLAAPGFERSHICASLRSMPTRSLSGHPFAHHATISSVVIRWS